MTLLVGFDSSQRASQHFSRSACHILVDHRTRTNFRGTYISRMPQIQRFCDFIFEDHRISFRGHYYKKNFRRLNFVDHTLSAKTAKFMSLENLYEYGI